MNYLRATSYSLPDDMCWDGATLKPTSALKGRKLDGMCVTITDGNCVSMTTGASTAIGAVQAANKAFMCIPTTAAQCLDLATGAPVTKTATLLRSGDTGVAFTPSNMGRCTNQTGGATALDKCLDTAK